MKLHVAVPRIHVGVSRFPTIGGKLLLVGLASWLGIVQFSYHSYSTRIGVLLVKEGFTLHSEKTGFRAAPFPF